MYQAKVDELDTKNYTYVAYLRCNTIYVSFTCLVWNIFVSEVDHREIPDMCWYFRMSEVSVRNTSMCVRAWISS
jgi:hypothetical protein